MTLSSASACPSGPDPVYGKAAERFGELCARLGLRGTAFAVGEPLADPAAARALQRHLARLLAAVADSPSAARAALEEARAARGALF